MLDIVPSGLSGLTRLALCMPPGLGDERVRLAIFQIAAPAQNLETPERASDLHRQVVAPREDECGQGVAGILARTLPGINAVADSHREFFVCASPRGSGCLRSIRGMVFSGAFDLLREASHLATPGCCAAGFICSRSAQLVQLTNFGVHFDLFHNRGIARGDGLDLGVSESAAFEVFRLADGDAAVHDLIDEACFRLQYLPHICIERSLRDVAMDLDFGIIVTLPQDSALALLDIPRSTRGVEVVQSDEPPLYVGAGAHFFGRSEQDAYAPGVYRIE